MRQPFILVLVILTLSLSKSKENHIQDAKSKKMSHEITFERKSEIRSIIKTVLRAQSLTIELTKQNVEDIFPPAHLCRKGCHFDGRCGKCFRGGFRLFRTCNKRLC